jgi:hypothetical protein
MGSKLFPRGGAQYNDAWIASHLDDVAAVLHVGDLAYDRGNESLWDDFFTDIEPFAARRPYLTCVGNEDHAYDFAAYRNRFYLPSQQLGETTPMFWSIDIGTVHIVSISTEVGAEPYEEGSRQYSWLAADLAKADKNRERVPWVVVLGHRPMYCSSSDYYDCNMWGPKARSVFEPLFQKFHVDLYFCGHVHSYERTTPVFNGTKVDAGTIHAMVGMGGAGLSSHPGKHPQAWTASRNIEFGIAKVKANSSQLCLDMIAAETSEILDSVTLRKDVIFV